MLIHTGQHSPRAVGLEGMLHTHRLMRGSLGPTSSAHEPPLPCTSIAP